MGNSIIALGIAILFFQWLHPLQYLRLNLLISKKLYIIILSTGTLFVISLVAWFIYFAKNIDIISIEEPVVAEVFLSVFTILYIVFNFTLTIYAFIKAKIKGRNFHRNLLLIPIIPFAFIIAYGFVLFIYTIFGGAYTYDLTNIIKIFNNDELMIRLLLLSFVTVMAYIVIQYIETVTLKIDLKIEENKVIRNKQIEHRLNYNTLSLVFLVGTMISFFHFAEIDTSVFSNHFQLVYQRTLDVFQMIASALFIPLFLNRLLDKALKK
jgi:hypothetical protein